MRDYSPTIHEANDKTDCAYATVRMYVFEALQQNPVFHLRELLVVSPYHHERISEFVMSSDDSRI